MATAQELAEHIGKVAHLSVAGSRALKFNVVILDARKRYGKLDYKVTPVAGDGETWHEESQITFYAGDISGEHMFGEQVFGSMTGKA